MSADHLAPPPSRRLIDLAIDAAVASPCAKSKRGVIVFIDGVVVGRSNNGPPGDLDCGSSCYIAAREDARLRIGARSVCAQRCVHAEVRAIRSALVHVTRAITLASIGLVDPPTPGDFGTWVRMAMRKANALHVKVVDGELVPSGGPSCAECAREVRDTLGGFWLYEDPVRWPGTRSAHRGGLGAWCHYDADEFHRASLEAAGLPAFDPPLFPEADLRRDARPLLAMGPDDWRV